MPTSFSPLTTAYIESLNSADSGAFVACFAPDAVVRDEGHEYRGSAAIKAWIEQAHQKYQPKTEVLSVVEGEGGVVITGRVSGAFPGSPVILRHHLTVADGRIARLAIEA